MRPAKVHMKFPVWKLSRIKLREEYRLRNKGRWGPRWLHRLIWRMANNTGMIEHPIEETETVHYASMPTTAIEYVSACCLAYCQEGFDLKDLVGFCGPEFIALAAQDFHGFTLEAPVTIGQGGEDGRLRYHVRGVPIYVSPWMEGCIIVPKPGSFGL